MFQVWGSPTELSLWRCVVVPTRREPRPLASSTWQHLKLAEVNALGYNHIMHKHLRRLERIWIDFPIYFVTTCVHNRKAVLARNEAAQILVEEWRAARRRHGWAIGRYVIMPDHVHFFCRAEIGAKTLSDFVGNWKSWSSRRIRALDQPRSAPAATTLWQREFFDHALRSNESYSEKWNYVRENPVRAGLISSADDWPYAGEIETLIL